MPETDVAVIPYVFNVRNYKKVKNVMNIFAVRYLAIFVTCFFTKELKLRWFLMDDIETLGADVFGILSENLRMNVPDETVTGVNYKLEDAKKGMRCDSLLA